MEGKIMTDVSQSGTTGSSQDRVPQSAPMMETEIKRRYDISFGVTDYLMAANARVPQVYEDNVEEFYMNPFHQWFEEEFYGFALEDAIRGYYLGIMGGTILLYLDGEGCPATCLSSERNSIVGMELAMIRYSVNMENI